MTAPSSTRARAPDFAALETEVIQLHPGLLNRSNHHDLPATSDIKRRLGHNAERILRYFGIDIEHWDTVNKDATTAPAIYNLDECKGAGVAWLVENKLDAWTAFAAGGIKAFCFTAGAGYEPTQADIAKIASAGIRELRVLFPADLQGTRGSLSVAAKLAAGLHGDDNNGGTRITLHRWPSGTSQGGGFNALWQTCNFNAQEFQAALTKLQAVEIPLVPRGGYWWPGETPFVYPDGYVLGEHGTYKITTDRKTGARHLASIVPYPVWIEGRYSDVDGADHAVMIAARIGRRTVRHVVAQSTIASATSIPALSDIGFVGFTSAVATDLVRYLAAAQAANFSTLPERLTVSRMGWQSGYGGEKNFILGTTILHADGSEEQAEPGVRTGALAAILEHHQPAGTLEAEAECLSTIMQYPIVGTLYLASIASALNEILGVPPTIWQTAGESSVGKTSALSITRSPWGDPASRALASMNSTNVGVEIMLSAHGAVACMLDELKSHGRGRFADEAMTQMIYMISEGQGRIRGARTLTLQDTKRWSCNVIITGEHKVTDAAEDTGVFARAYAFWGAPWGETSEKTAAVIRQLRTTLEANHGHIGRAVVRHLMTTPIETLRPAYDGAQKKFVDAAPSSTPRNFSERWAESYAALALAGEILETLFPDQLPAGTCEKALLVTWDETCGRIRETSYAERAIEAVREYVAQRWSDIDGVMVDDDMPRRREVIGRLTNRGISLLPGALEEYLKGRGFSLKKALEHWRDESWIALDSAGNSTIPQRVSGSVTRVVAFKLGLIEERSQAGPEILPPDDTTPL